jgi:hypothetical protein
LFDATSKESNTFLVVKGSVTFFCWNRSLKGPEPAKSSPTLPSTPNAAASAPEQSEANCDPPKQTARSLMGVRPVLNDPRHHMVGCSQNCITEARAALDASVQRGASRVGRSTCAETRPRCAARRCSRTPCTGSDQAPGTGRPYGCRCARPPTWTGRAKGSARLVHTPPGLRCRGMRRLLPVRSAARPQPRCTRVRGRVQASSLSAVPTLTVLSGILGIRHLTQQNRDVVADGSQDLPRKVPLLPNLEDRDEHPVRAELLRSPRVCGRITAFALSGAFGPAPVAPVAPSEPGDPASTSGSATSPAPRSVPPHRSPFDWLDVGGVGVDATRGASQS